MLLGRPHGSELPEKQQVVDDLERAADQERQNLERRGEGRASNRRTCGRGKATRHGGKARSRSALRWGDHGHDIG